MNERIFGNAEDNADWLRPESVNNLGVLGRTPEGMGAIFSGTLKAKADALFDDPYKLPRMDDQTAHRRDLTRIECVAYSVTYRKAKLRIIADRLSTLTKKHGIQID